METLLFTIYIVGVIIGGFGGVIYCASQENEYYHPFHISIPVEDMGDCFQLFCSSFLCFMIAFIWPLILPLAILMIPIYYVAKLGNNLSTIKKNWLDRVKASLVENLKEDK